MTLVLTRAEVLDKMTAALDARQLQAQNYPTDSRAICAYLTEEGFRCAWGACFPDDSELLNLESTVGALLEFKNLAVVGMHPAEAQALQTLHDYWTKGLAFDEYDCDTGVDYVTEFFTKHDGEVANETLFREFLELVKSHG